MDNVVLIFLLKNQIKTYNLYCKDSYPISKCRKTFDGFYDTNLTEYILCDTLCYNINTMKMVFSALLPTERRVSGNVVESFPTDALRSADNSFATDCDNSIMRSLVVRLHNTYFKLQYGSVP